MSVAVSSFFSRRAGGVFCCFCACFLWSLSGVYSRFIQHADIPTAVVVRNTTFGVLLGLWLTWRTGLPSIMPYLAGRKIWAVSSLNALSSISYIAALLLAPVANVLIIYATMALCAAALSWLFLGTHTERSTLLAAVAAVIGVGIIFGGGTADWNTTLGNALALVMTVSAAYVMIMMRQNTNTLSVLIAVITATISVAACLPFAHFGGLEVRETILLGCYGLSGGIAFVLLMVGVRMLSPVEAGLIATLDVVLAPAWVFLAFGEAPAMRTWIGGAVILTAILGHLYVSRPAPVIAGEA